MEIGYYITYPTEFTQTPGEDFQRKYANILAEILSNLALHT